MIAHSQPNNRADVFDKKSASGVTRKKAHCIESRHEDDAMPSQMSERSDLAEQIARCRRLANAITDQATVQLLLAMAIEYELRLNRISQRQTP
jgi:hypothetical protein